MSERSLPHHCDLRTATKGDRWALQKLVWHLIWAEALGFDLRLIGYRLGKLGLLSLLIGVELWLMPRLPSPEWQSVVLVLLLLTLLWAIATSFILLLYVVLMPLEPLLNWSGYCLVACHQRPVACAALSDFGHFAVLYHVVVDPAWRRQGLASELIQYLLQSTNSQIPIYLVCKPQLVPFYEPLGFRVRSWRQLAPPLKSHFRDFIWDRRRHHCRWEIMGFSQNETLPHHPQ